LVLTAVFLKLLRTPLTLIDPEDEYIKIFKKTGEVFTPGTAPHPIILQS
jgi:hypothetical protein